ncbi:MAG: iron ABC transporter permease [Planctomycetota bacterium]
MRARTALLALAAASAVVVTGAPLVGPEHLPLSAVLRPEVGDANAIIFWDIRLPRVFLAYLAGSALALSGMAFQALFRNPLATPFTLGVSSGASLGAVLSIRAGLSATLLGASAMSIASFAGAILAITLVYGLTQFRRGFSTSSMLLAGVAVNFFFSSLILFLQYWGDFWDTFNILRWLIGGVQLVGMETVLRLLPATVLAVAVTLLLTHELNLLTTGEDLATSRGVPVPRVKRILFVSISLVVGGVVAVCGPIGFVGLMCPHICRLLVGPNHHVLMPATFLFGGIFLVVCDTAARTALAPTEMPVGIFTAFLGGPFFLWLLLRGSSQCGGAAAK